MLTEEQILTAVESGQFNKYENLDRLAFYRGAVWANKQNAAEIAEIENANKALSLQVEILSGAYETSERRVKELESALKMLCDEVFDIYDSKHLDPKKSEGYKTGMRLLKKHNR